MSVPAFDFANSLSSSNQDSEFEDSSLSAASDKSIPLASCVGCNTTGPLGHYCLSCPDIGFIFADCIPSDPPTNPTPSIASSNFLSATGIPNLTDFETSSSPIDTQQRKPSPLFNSSFLTTTFLKPASRFDVTVFVLGQVL